MVRLAAKRGMAITPRRRDGRAAAPGAWPPPPREDLPEVVARRHAGHEGAVLMARDFEHAAQLRDREAMLVDPEIEAGIALFMKDLERGGLLAALVAAGGLSRFEHQQQAFVEFQRRAFLEGRRHRLDRLGTGQHVALTGTCSGPSRGPPRARSLLRSRQRRRPGRRRYPADARPGRGRRRSASATPRTPAAPAPGAPGRRCPDRG